MNTITSEMRGIYRRGRIFWIAYKAGNRIARESTGTPDRKLAEGVLAKRRAEVFEGRWVGRLRDVKTPVQEEIKEFLTVYSQPRKVSWKDDAIILRRFSAFVGPTTHVQEIDRRLIERFQLHLLTKKISKARVNRYIAIVKCLFNRLIDWGKLQSNPCRGIKLYQEPPRTHWLEPGQIADLLAHCSARLKPIVQVALLTGLRKGDVLRLTWDRIEFEQMMIRIVQSKTKSALHLPMSPALAAVLRSVPKDVDCPYVFHERQRPLRPYGWVRTDFLRATKDAGVAGTRFHDLRHTAATQLRRLGRDLQIVQQALGHKSIRTTLRYSHVHPTELKDAMNKLGDKIMNSVGHFTITSQSDINGVPPNIRAARNEATFKSNQQDDLSGNSPIPQTVNPQKHRLKNTN
jgi:integrase